MIDDCHNSGPCHISGRHADLNGGPTLAVTDWLNVGSVVCGNNYGVVTNGYVVSSSGTRLINSSPRNDHLIMALCDLEINWTWKVLEQSIRKG